jgi:hypothetical protein
MERGREGERERRRREEREREMKEEEERKLEVCRGKFHTSSFPPCCFPSHS